MPLTEKQKEYLMNCGRRWNIKTGATGSGKSFVDYAAVIPKRIMACQGVGLIVLLGNTRGTLERNILEPMRDIWGSSLVGNVRSNNTVYLFGKKVYALGADNKKHISRIQGATFEYVYGDEVTTWDKGVFEMLKSRLRSSHSCFDGTCNPDNPEHWLKKFLDSDADIYQQHYTIDDGCLPPHVVEELKKEYSGSVFYNRFILGEWASADGLVYDMFYKGRHVAEKLPETEGFYYVSADYGIQNATVFLLWQKEKGTNRWVCLDEWYYSGRDNKKLKTVTELVAGLNDMLGERKPKEVILDPSATALKVELRKNGYKVRAAENDVLNGIADVSTMLQSERLLFSEKCQSTIREFGVYAWDEKAASRGEDAPIKENDHGMDAVRYFVRTMRLVRRDTANAIKQTGSYLL